MYKDSSKKGFTSLLLSKYYCYYLRFELNHFFLAYTCLNFFLSGTNIIEMTPSTPYIRS